MKLKGVHLRGVPLSGIGTPRNGGAATEFWKGCYSDFMLFSRTLTPEEIAIVKKFIT